MRIVDGTVIVITGASSGLGKAAALEFARYDCRLILAARRRDALEETAREVAALGALAHVVPTDVTRESEVNALVEAALALGGRIDVWINNAGVTLFSLLEAAPFEEHRRVIETNLFGPMYAARAVAPVFRRQKRGILINVGSVLSKVGQPFVPSYVISKFALRGLSEVLSSEFADEEDVHICSLYPYAMNTPHFQSGANRIGRNPHAMPPEQAPEKAARALVSLVEHPRRELHVPRMAALGLLVRDLFPRTTERLLLHALRQWHFDERGTSGSAGNLYEGDPGSSAVSGSRAPRISTPKFVLWVLRELLLMQSNALRRALGRAGARARVSSARSLEGHPFGSDGATRRAPGAP
jgi:short-subunit dehydrogenase